MHSVKGSIWFFCSLYGKMKSLLGNQWKPKSENLENYADQKRLRMEILPRELLHSKAEPDRTRGPNSDVVGCVRSEHWLRNAIAGPCSFLFVDFHFLKFRKPKFHSHVVLQKFYSDNVLKNSDILGFLDFLDFHKKKKRRHSKE